MKRYLAALGVATVLYLALTAVIAATASATLPYVIGVLFHIGAGIALFPLCWWVARRDRGLLPAAGLLTASLLFALYLSAGAYIDGLGNLRANRWALWCHIASGAASVVALWWYARRRAAVDGGGWLRFRKGLEAAAVMLLVLPIGMATARAVWPPANHRIANPEIVPASMDGEGGGPQSPFFPSSAKTNVGGIIPANFFMDSEACGQCHKDIYEQWKGSAHHFSSFNNQFYRKSIEYMQDVVGTKPSKWCAGCHDHAVFFNGRFDRPMSEQMDTPEAHAGLACTSCHSIVHVAGSMGNGGLTIEYPPLHDLATSKNAFVRAVDRFFTFADPEPHRRAFLKPFMREQTAEFCSSCHKVHLDIPVNEYRWVRGFNDYDNWQASGVSGQGARSFYYPEKSLHCGDCHMPLVPSKDPGNIDGQIHSHRFPGANTALPYVNRDHAQLSAVERFLQSGFITVDIFAVSPVDDRADQTAMIRRTGEGPQLMSGFAVGEESEQAGQVVIREVGKVSAPIDRSGAALEPGSTVRVDVVVRTRKIGHFFPGGTVDAFDVWLELEALDANGKHLFWSGRVDDEGKGPVERGAHFYRAYQLDGDGNMINKRNAWQMRSLLYVRLIPPGAADVAHYRVRIPKDAAGPVKFRARLQHRKFSHYYTQFSYAGEPKPGQDPSLLSKTHNSLEYSFSPANIPANVSGQIKDKIPVLPILTLAESIVQVPLGEPKWAPVAAKQDRERWNDWGIGLLLQGDLKGAEFAFRRVTEAEPGYADGWLNVARALIQEGETEAARPFVEKAMSINPSLGRVYFFKAMIEKADGDYDAALKSLRKAADFFPRDRVVLNQMGRILFLKRDFAGSIAALERVRAIDPEDLQMHYTAMLSYRGLGDREKAEQERILFQRFKAEESAQAITAKPRMLSPEDNNERQMIHDHESVNLAVERPQ